MRVPFCNAVQISLKDRGVIPANSSQTIYFSPQKVSGDLHYILEDINGIQQEGTLAYSDQTEYFRRITAEIGQDNQIKVSMN